MPGKRNVGVDAGYPAKLRLLPEYGCAQITLAESGEALVEGKIGILEYGSDCIKLCAGKKNIRFVGEQLYIRCLNCSSAVVMGRIGSIELDRGR